jgi:hypothetical protein
VGPKWGKESEYEDEFEYDWGNEKERGRVEDGILVLFRRRRMDRDFRIWRFCLSRQSD